ncbi:MAG: hypothetical protein V3T86_05835 [Planctomycetota bacterium]
MHRAFRLATYLIASLAFACGQNGDDHNTGSEKTDSQGHAHAAKFGGTLVEIGDHFAQAEIVFDNETGLITVYFWDGHVETPRRLKAKTIAATVTTPTGDVEVALAAQADALAGETIGNSSRFEAEVAALKGADAVKGSFGPLDFAGKIFAEVKFSAKAR